MKNLKPFLCLLFLIIAMEKKAVAQGFDGNFRGQQPGINSTASLIIDGAAITGNFTLNGRPGNVSATLNGNNCQGILYDIQMRKNYSFTGSIASDSLYFDIVFPELNNQVIHLAMARIGVANNDAATINTAGEKNTALIGLWRYTETFSSGSGDNYASFSTDYFMEFKADGTVFSWKGKSAGGMGDISLESKAGAAEKAGWYTEGKTLFLIDANTGNKASILFYAEPNRMMLHNGGKEKKIMTRVR